MQKISLSYQNHIDLCQCYLFKHYIFCRFCLLVTEKDFYQVPCKERTFLVLDFQIYSVEIGTKELKRVSLLSASLYPRSCVRFLCPLHQILRDFSMVRRAQNVEGRIQIIKIDIVQFDKGDEFLYKFENVNTL